jgi:hypothetical protein
MHGRNRSVASIDVDAAVDFFPAQMAAVVEQFI